MLMKRRQAGRRRKLVVDPLQGEFEPVQWIWRARLGTDSTWFVQILPEFVRSEFPLCSYAAMSPSSASSRVSNSLVLSENSLISLSLTTREQGSGSARSHIVFVQAYNSVKTWSSQPVGDSRILLLFGSPTVHKPERTVPSVVVKIGELQSWSARLIVPCSNLASSSLWFKAALTVVDNRWRCILQKLIRLVDRFQRLNLCTFGG